jgi:hypothetical protein
MVEGRDLRSDSHINHDVHPACVNFVDCLTEIIDGAKMGI